MVDCFVSNKLNIYLECLCYIVKIVFVLHLWQTLGLGLCNRKVDRLQKETLAVASEKATFVNSYKSPLLGRVKRGPVRTSKRCVTLSRRENV